MKNLLVPVPEHGDLMPVAKSIRIVADRFGSLVQGLALAPDLSRTIAAEFPIDPHYIDPDNRLQLVSEARKRFVAVMNDVGLDPAADNLALADDAAATWRFVDDELREDARVASYARVFDMVTLARPDKGGAGARLATVETMLFESGRPVLIVPPSPGNTIGSHVVVAWNGSLETARALSHSMPILKKADRVTVLALDGWQIDGPRPADQVNALKRHGIAAGLEVRPLSGGPGESLLAASRSLGADLIVKGAYTQSRLRQMIFGGATSHLLTHTDIPMLIAH